MAAEETAHPAGYSSSVRRAWADALELANLQVEVLTQLHDADQRGDDVEVQRCVAALDHVMDQVAEAERVRGKLGGDAPPDASEGFQESATLDEPSCAECGALTQPVFDPPRLLGYRCPHCHWTADDPAAQAAGKLDAARDAAISAIRPAPGTIGKALAGVRQRRKKQHEQGLRDLEAVAASLDTAVKRVARAEDQLRAARHDTGQDAAAGR